MERIDTSKYRALLFDFDGTMVDSEPVHYKALTQTLGGYGKTYVTFDDHRRLYMA
jgi:beta-phosphoglucomutase-like phosphatase (HAD superfamily)